MCYDVRHMDNTITTSEAGRIAGVSAETIRRLARTKRIAAQKFGQTLMINPDSLSQYLQSESVAVWRKSHGKGGNSGTSTRRA